MPSQWPDSSADNIRTAVDDLCGLHRRLLYGAQALLVVLDRPAQSRDISDQVRGHMAELGPARPLEAERAEIYASLQADIGVLHRLTAELAELRLAVARPTQPER